MVCYKFTNLQTKGENLSISIYQFIPLVSDTGKSLTCRGENPVLADSIIEDILVLNIYRKYCSTHGINLFIV